MYNTAFIIIATMSRPMSYVVIFSMTRFPLQQPKPMSLTKRNCTSAKATSFFGRVSLGFCWTEWGVSNGCTMAAS